MKFFSPIIPTKCDSFLKKTVVVGSVTKKLFLYSNIFSYSISGAMLSTLFSKNVSLVSVKSMLSFVRSKVDFIISEWYFSVVFISVIFLIKSL